MYDRFFYRAGHRLMAFIDYMGELTLFSAEAVLSMFHPPFFFRETVAQMYHLGVRSLPLVVMASFSVGLVLAMQSVKVLSWFGASNYIATTVGLSMVRELGPLMAAMMVAARGGSGIGAEIGSMRVTSQIDALTVSAVNPMKFLVATRIMACVLVMPFLAVISDIVGILGGLVIGMTQVGLTANFYYHLTIKYMSLRDVLPGIGKTMVFGGIIGAVGCFHGYYTSHGTFGVGQSTKAAVVAAILLILVSDVFLTRLSLIIWP